MECLSCAVVVDRDCKLFGLGQCCRPEDIAPGEVVLSSLEIPCERGALVCIVEGLVLKLVDVVEGDVFGLCGSWFLCCLAGWWSVWYWFCVDAPNVAVVEFRGLLHV